MTTPEETAWPTEEQLAVRRLGPCRYPSPVPRPRMVEESRRVLLGSELDDVAAFAGSGCRPPSFELAGARERLFFDPEKLTCGIVTCGGLCPGLNNVIRSMVLELSHAYGVRNILGFRYGFAGLTPSGEEPLQLSREIVGRLHRRGGTILGSSRGPQDVGEMVDTLVRRNVGILFVIGGDGGLHGAAALHREIARRGLPIAVIGTPKTIDNDLRYTWRSFGFDTAVEAASSTILSAHVEAEGAWNGIGLVKLMGRHAGFIAAHATLGCSDVNFCLVPEVPFTLDGTGGFLEALEHRLEQRRHAVVVVAEGAGQELIPPSGEQQQDASGNVRLQDIGIYLRDRIREHFARRDKPAIVRYIDPSYIIRSLPANSSDAQFCLVLGQCAVHAGMAGRTNMLVGAWNQRLVHVPIPLAVERREQIRPDRGLWLRVLEATGQPASMVGCRG